MALVCHRPMPRNVGHCHLNRFDASELVTQAVAPIAFSRPANRANARLQRGGSAPSLHGRKSCRGQAPCREQFKQRPSGWELNGGRPNSSPCAGSYQEGRSSCLEFHRPFHEAYRTVAFQRNLDRIKILFAEADADGSGCLDLEELHVAMMKPQMRASFAAVGIQPHQADKVFEVMDVHGKGELNLQEFIDGLKQITELDIDGISPDLDVKQLLAANRRKFLRDRAQHRSDAASGNGEWMEGGGVGREGSKRSSPAGSRPNTAPDNRGTHGRPPEGFGGGSAAGAGGPDLFGATKNIVEELDQRRSIMFARTTGSSALGETLLFRPRSVSGHRDRKESFAY